LATAPRDANAILKLRYHRANTYEPILEKLHAAGEIEFYDPSTHLRIRDASEVADPVVDVDKVGRQIIEYSAKQVTSTVTVSIAAAGDSTSNLPQSEEIVQPIPGKSQKTLMGKVMVKAAWEIECEQNRRATAQEVFSRLTQWIAEKRETDVLISIEKRVIIWLNKGYGESKYGIGACEKALERWNKSRH
jgi:hypothetical protein